MNFEDQKAADGVNVNDAIRGLRCVVIDCNYSRTDAQRTRQKERVTPAITV